MKILLTGATGMLGKDVFQTFSKAGHEVIATERNDLDITHLVPVLNYVKSIKPDLIINCAAYNFVDQVESDEFYSLAFAVNATGPKNLAIAARDNNIPIIHFSTDYVFDGLKAEGYTEEDSPSPISRYGDTKFHGEKLIEEVGGKYYICRLSKLFGEAGTSDVSKESFVSIMLKLAKEKDKLQIVASETGCPSYSPDIAAAVLQIAEGDFDFGIYHLVNDGGGVTWYEFAKEIFEIAGVDILIEAVEPSHFPRPARRPAEAILLNTKFPILRHRQDALSEFISLLKP
jgi:dTDP-4-dehydrorhamnose reductase